MPLKLHVIQPASQPENLSAPIIVFIQRQNHSRTLPTLIRMTRRIVYLIGFSFPQLLMLSMVLLGSSVLSCPSIFF